MPTKLRNLCAVATNGGDGMSILIEAESFDYCGGWMLDQQFMDQMGSPYLLAHGLGVPVEDAVTTLNGSPGGRFRLWVRTFDWVAPWYPSPSPSEAPGRFEVLINGTAVPTLFGTEGADWHWQDGGIVDLPAGQVTVALHDLVGFEGRCGMRSSSLTIWISFHLMTPKH